MAMKCVVNNRPAVSPMGDEPQGADGRQGIVAHIWQFKLSLEKIDPSVDCLKFVSYF